MAQCTTCGQKAGMFMTVCNSCSLKEQEEARQRQAAQNAAQHEAEMRLRNEKMVDWQIISKDRLSQGQPLYVYKTIYLEVDSVVNDETVGTFDTSFLEAAGLAGWQVISVIPRTVGIGLTNTSYGSTSGSTWGGGIGGNVAGVYVLIGRQIQSSTDSAYEEFAVPSAQAIVDGGGDLF